MTQTVEAFQTRLDLRVGDVVEVREAAEILATLDENGELESLPFMREMLQYCGQQLTVYKIAHKTCDTQTSTGMRRMNNAVHLAGVRCDGGGHDGCQAACLIYWKHAWLRKVDRAGTAVDPTAASDQVSAAVPQPTENARLLPLLATSSRGPMTEDGTVTYRCQATELLRAAPEKLPVRHLDQFVQDVRTGNVGVFWSLRAFLVLLYNRMQGLSNRLPSPLRIRGGRSWGLLRGTSTGKTPTGSTGLQPGDTVRIKSRQEIEPTLNSEQLNRGMGFDAEMARFCGRTARVARRVDQIIDERTGRMLHVKNPCIVLEGVVCEGAYNANCPRSIVSYWREIWLDKVDTDQAGPPRASYDGQFLTGEAVSGTTG